MNRKKVLLVLAHAHSGSYGAALGDAYAEGARAAGHEVEVLKLDALQFDPILREGYRRAQPLEPDLQAAQASIRRAEHLAFVYPIWWGSVPALLKGFIDRVFLPGFAFRYQEGQRFPQQLLAGKSADLLATMDTPPWYFRWFFRAPGLHQMRKTTLEFCGVRPVRTLSLGPVLGSSAAQRKAGLERARALAAGL